MAQDKSFRLRLNAEDLQRWRREARGKSLAEWIREKCNQGDIAAVDAVMAGSEVIEEFTGEVYVSAAAPRRAICEHSYGAFECPFSTCRNSKWQHGAPPLCKHGRAQGQKCWQCDAKWGFPC